MFSPKVHTDERIKDHFMIRLVGFWRWNRGSDLDRVESVKIPSFSRQHRTPSNSTSISFSTGNFDTPVMHRFCNPDQLKFFGTGGEGRPTMTTSDPNGCLRTGSVTSLRRYITLVSTSRMIHRNLARRLESMRKLKIMPW